MLEDITSSLESGAFNQEWSEPQFTNEYEFSGPPGKTYLLVNPNLTERIKSRLRSTKKSRKNFLYHYLYFCSTVAFLNTIDKRFKEHEYVSINYKVMTSIISKYNYSEIISNLIKWNILECDDSYSVGSKSKGYKLLPPYNKHFKQKKLQDPGIIQKLNKYYKSTQTMIKKLPAPYQYLQMTNTWIKMDNAKATDYNFQNYFSEPSMTVYDSNYYSISSYSDEAYRFTVDTTGYRAHTNLTNLKSDLRKFLIVEGEPLSQIDIKNSQPLFFYLHIKDIDSIAENEKMRYKELVESGQFYEFFMSRLNIPSSKREIIKQKVLTALFFDHNRKDHSRYIKAFSNNFPAITAYILRIKEKDYKILAGILQRAESKMVIEHVVAEFIKRFGHNKEFISTIHDSIVVKSSMLKEAKQIVEECFFTQGLKPGLKTVDFR